SLAAEIVDRYRRLWGVAAIKITRTATSLAGDFWGGFAAMLVVLPSSVAFGIMVYTALGPEYAGRGAMAGLLGAAALGVVAPIVGRTAGLISTPCAPAAAVLSAESQARPWLPAVFL